ncbi:hypothetical protein SEMRO_1355_G265550.1 [Seminavis robusta]|uniref:Uncharacterized protein n=1 Tax=Seminavis robusta TaxID=568900 RepID=A0A9N8EP50_9STRA|nr:hypothetical protein SEMRO_1355_G265550.1 [Seminavis robusta]|eukprot:Sro1355_g265550.1 n/a (213) ;mRNA; r:15915-16553
MRKNLADYLKNPRKTLERIGKEKREKDRQKNKSGKVKWVTHPAKEIFDEDVEPGGWLYDQDDLDARLVWKTYKSKQEEFEDVSFEQFEPIYIKAMQRAAKRRSRSKQEEEWMKHDRRLHPRQTHNHRGEPVFDMDVAAKEQLREDVEKKLYKKMKPMELHAMREVYHKYKLGIFRQRIYQEKRRQKFNRYLEKKRTEKRRKYAAKYMRFERK